MTDSNHGPVENIRYYDDTAAAFERIKEIYDKGVGYIHDSFLRFAAGKPDANQTRACYPYVGLTVSKADLRLDVRRAYGSVSEDGSWGTTITRPDLFEDYLRKQLDLLIENHGQQIAVGVSDRPIPLPFVIEEAVADITAEDVMALREKFPLPDMRRIHDSIANGTYETEAGRPRPLSLFSAERIDYSLVRLAHYTGTSAKYFQRFVLFTNYQRYVDEFIEFAHDQVANGDVYSAFIEPGDVITRNPKFDAGGNQSGAAVSSPQMPAYHLVLGEHDGITLVNIGVGPSNAKTITDHIAVLRPHCWLMVGHCGGLRHTQRLGDYVLAHAYSREDHVLDQDLPVTVPVPPIAEIQVALSEAVAQITGLEPHEMKTRLRTGTVVTTDDRDWELRRSELAKRFNQSRAIAVDMESATIAANGFRFRVPYGTLLCVSDKPLHGEIKLPGMANTFYRQRISQHLRIGIETLTMLREAGVEKLHSRKLRSFDEPPFR